MQVAKYWRNNQLRYRLQGVVQQKVKPELGIKSVETSDSQQVKMQNTSKIKVA